MALTPALLPFPARVSASGRPVWTGTWEAAASGTTTQLPGQSVRNVIHTSVGGLTARIRVSNRLGTAASPPPRCPRARTR